MAIRRKKNSRNRKNPAQEDRRRRIFFGLELILLTGLIIAFIGLGVTVGLFYSYGHDLPSLEPLEAYNQPATWAQSTRVLDRDGKQIGAFFEEDRRILRYDQIPPIMVNAIVAVEDKRFWSHPGIDLIRTSNAVFQAVFRGHRPRGTSTITQQLARDLFLTRDRNLKRKIKEAILAYRIEQEFSKEEILERYLNKTFLGNGAYGLSAAADRYFGKDLTNPEVNLTLAEAALLAGIPQAPTSYNPVLHPEAAKRRQQVVLALMAQQGYCTKEEAETSFNEFWIEFEKRASLPKVERSLTQSRAPWFMEYVRSQLQDQMDYDAIYRGGLTIQTSLNLGYQAEAERAVAEGLARLNEEIARRRGTTVEAMKNKLQAALICIDPNTGEILAMVGGSHFGADNQLNRAVQSERQPGSAFKPFVYAEALSQGYTLANTIVDAPIEMPLDTGEVWRPQNYSREFHSLMTLRYALEKSVNIPAVKLGQEVGLTNVISLAHASGIGSELKPYPSLALGSFEVRPIDLCSAYAVFENQGQWTQPHGILQISDPHNRILFQTIPERRQVLPPETAYLMTYALQGVVQRGTAAGSVGAKLGRPAAGKTGTTDEYSDAWFVGYTPQLCTAVWVGFDQSSISMGGGFSGSHAAAPIWTDFMKAASLELPVENFAVAENIVFVDVDRYSGLLASPESTETIREAFLEGTQPNQFHTGESMLGQPDAAYSLSPMMDEESYTGGNPKEVPMTVDGIPSRTLNDAARTEVSIDTNIVRHTRAPRVAGPRVDEGVGEGRRDENRLPAPQ